MSMKKKILMIDDEQDYADMVQMRLEANHYEVVTANNGADGLQAAQTQHPDLILLDVMMPGMDGFEVLRKLRRSETTKHIPVVMLTAKGESKAIFHSQELGANDHLIKPCESQELLDVVARHA
jgi:DNA-binding response OmpR family regulator